MSDRDTLQAELDLVRKANEVLSEQWQRRANAMSHELDALRKELAITRWERNALTRAKQMREEQQGLRLSRAFELLFIDDMQNALAEDMWAAIFGRIEMLMETDGAEGHIKAHGKGQESVMQLVAGAVGDGCPTDSMKSILEAIGALRRERDEATARRERVIAVQQEIARERDAALKERDQWRESAEAGWAQAADLAQQEQAAHEEIAEVYDGFEEIERTKGERLSYAVLCGLRHHERLAEEAASERDEAQALLKEQRAAATELTGEVLALKAELAQARDAYRKGGPVWRAAWDAAIDAGEGSTTDDEAQNIADRVCARLSDGALRLSPLLAACNRASIGGHSGPADDEEAVAELRKHLQLTSGSLIDAVAALGTLADKVRATAANLAPPQEWRSIAACWDVVEAALPRWRLGSVWHKGVDMATGPSWTAEVETPAGPAAPQWRPVTEVEPAVGEWVIGLLAGHNKGEPVLRRPLRDGWKTIRGIVGSHALDGWLPLDDVMPRRQPPPAGPVAPPRASTGADLIAAERQRQMAKEGWTPAHDDEHVSGELAWAAVCYAAPGSVYSDGSDMVDPWPWAKEWDKRDKHDRQRRLVIAGALIAAEIDRLRRLAGPVAPKEPPDAPPAVPGPGSAGVPVAPAGGADLAAPAQAAAPPLRQEAARGPARADVAEADAPPAGQAMAEGGPAGVEAPPPVAPLAGWVKTLRHAQQIVFEGKHVGVAWELLDNLGDEMERHAKDQPASLAAKLEALAKELKQALAERDEARAAVRMATAHRDDVWIWQGIGDEPASLSCPVVMSAQTLRDLLGAHKPAAAPLSPDVRALAEEVLRLNESAGKTLSQIMDDHDLICRHGMVIARALLATPAPAQAAPPAPRVVTLADLHTDELDGNAEVVVAEADLVSDDGFVASRGAVLIAERKAARGQMKIRIFGEHGAKYALASSKVRRLGMSWQEFVSDTMEPAPCEGCARLTEERDAARADARENSNEADRALIAQDKAEQERDALQRDLAEARGDARRELATKQEIIDHVVLRLGNTPSLVHRVDAHAALVRDLAALKGSLRGDVYVLAQRARALLDSDSDPRQGKQGGTDLPEPVAVPVADLLHLASLSLDFGRVERATRHQDGKRPETDSDHTVMLGLIACAYAARYAPHLDLGLIAQYTLVHDFVEVYSGDVLSLGLSAYKRAIKEQREQEALERLRGELAGLPWVAQTIATYEALGSEEARFVKVLDKVLPKLTHLLNGGAALREHGFTFAKAHQDHQEQRAMMAAKYPQADALTVFDAVIGRCAEEWQGKPGGGEVLPADKGVEAALDCLSTADMMLRDLPGDDAADARKAVARAQGWLTPLVPAAGLPDGLYLVQHPTQGVVRKVPHSMPLTSRKYRTPGGRE